MALAHLNGEEQTPEDKALLRHSLERALVELDFPIFDADGERISDFKMMVNRGRQAMRAMEAAETQKKTRQGRRPLSGGGGA